MDKITDTLFNWLFEGILPWVLMNRSVTLCVTPSVKDCTVIRVVECEFLYRRVVMYTCKLRILGMHYFNQINTFNDKFLVIYDVYLVTLV